MASLRAALICGLATACLASTNNKRAASTVTLFPPISGTPTIAAACESVSSVWASYRSIAATATATPSYITEPSLALACLKSVPVDVENDVALIDYLLPWASWHSTIGYLKNPPEGYLVPGIDVIGGMQEIRQKLRDGGYTNQYEFTRDVRAIFQAAQDEHFQYQPALNSVFGFARGIALASVSSDGLELPKVYWIQDIQGFSSVRSGVSDIVKIDGIDVETYLINSAPAIHWSQDPDALYNSQMWTIPGVASGTENWFYRAGYPSLPDSSTYEFRNGTTWTVPNRALINVQFYGITTGEDLHAVVELNRTTTVNTRAATTDEVSDISKRASSCVKQAGSYPSPVVIHCQGYVSGYYLDDNTCVLVLYHFEGTLDDTYTGTDDMNETRNVTRTFFSKCKASGRTKLIVDVSSNDGGLVFMGHDLYRNLFPNSTNWSGARFRAHAGFDWVGQTLADAGKGIVALIGNVISADEKEINTWSDLYGPWKGSEDYETKVSIWNFSDPTTASGSADPFTVTGYDPSDQAPAQPFAAEDIVVLTDGVCGSTCSIFTGLMSREAGVRTIAVGGRPMKAPMQAVGATKGANNKAWSDIQASICLALNISSPPDNLVLPSLDDPPMLPLLGPDVGHLNWRNAYAQDATEGPPLQFVYEAANCRFFYKASHYNSMINLWADVAEVAWNGASCVEGSTTNDDGTISNGAVAYSSKVISQQQPYDGPGSLTNKVWQGLATNTTGTDEDLGPTVSGPTSPVLPSATSSSEKNAAQHVSISLGWQLILLVTAACFALL